MSRRTEQVGELLTREINQILLRYFEPPLGCLITISKTEATPDLKQAKVFVSVLPEKMTGTALSALRKQTGHVQHLLNNRLHMRNIPKIDWVFDDTHLKIARVEEALKQ